ncbi:25339_t:CDS:1, partial [Gigaspora rosea]
IDNADEVKDTVVDEVDSRKDDYGGYESQSEGNVFMDNKGKKRSNHNYKKGKIYATRSIAHKSSKLSYSNNDEEE